MTFYAFARMIVVGFCSLFFRVRVEGRERVPPTGGYLVAPSHRSGFDIPFTAYVTKRTLRFLAKEELFSYPVLGWLFRALGGIPVARGTADRGALRLLEDALREGSPVAIFPEGHRYEGPRLAPLFDGAGYLARRAGVPIVPVGIGGSQRIIPDGKWFPRPGRVAIVVGDPIYPPAPQSGGRRATVEALTAALATELQRCFDRAHELAG